MKIRIVFKVRTLTTNIKFIQLILLTLKCLKFAFITIEINRKKNRFSLRRIG